MSYDAQIATAQRLIDAKGGTITVRATRQAAPVAGTDRPATPPTKLSATPKAVVLPMPSKFVGSDLFGDGVLVTAADRMAYVAGAAMSWEILQGDTLDAEGRSWRIGSLKALRPDGGAVILYTLFLRKT